MATSPHDRLADLAADAPQRLPSGERETAELLGVSIGTVKSQARDALARLWVLLPTDDPRALT